MTCQFNFGNPVAAGDVVSVALFGVTNPTTTGPATVSASTTSDTQPGTTSVSITAAKTVTGVTASARSGLAARIDRRTLMTCYLLYRAVVSGAVHRGNAPCGERHETGSLTACQGQRIRE